MIRTIRLGLGLVVACVVAAIVVGCTSPSHPTTPVQSSTSNPAARPGHNGDGDANHAHKPGAHHGTIVEIGRDNFHAEAVFEKGGKLRLYTLGKDEAVIQEVEAQPVTAYVKAEGEGDAESVILRPEPQAGDKPGM